MSSRPISPKANLLVNMEFDTVMLILEQMRISSECRSVRVLGVLCVTGRFQLFV